LTTACCSRREQLRLTTSSSPIARIAGVRCSSTNSGFRSIGAPAAGPSPKKVPHADVEWRTIEIHFDLSRPQVQILLEGFLTGALGVKLIAPLDKLDDLPRECRTHVQLAQDAGSPWIAWATANGPIAAWGSIDVQGSRRTSSYLLLHVEWWDGVSGHHSLWCHCNPMRPTEWTVGRGNHNEPR
jgi:hypothetical protein